MSSSPVLVRARALTGFSALVEASQGDVAALLASVNLKPTVLENPEETLALSVFVALLEHTATALRMDDFGLQLASRQDISVLGPIALIARNAGTVRGTVEAVGRHLPYHTPGACLTWVPDQRAGYVQLRYDLALAPHAPRRHGIELSYAVAIDFLRLLSPGPIDDWQIWFRHTTGLSAARYQRRFSCPVRLGQEVDALIVPLALLDAPVNQHSPELLRMGERFVSNVMRRAPLDIAAQVEALVLRQLATGQCTLPHIAQQLGLHTRTLQRRLAQQGVFFEDITDQVRKARAQEYLPYASIALQQVASLLGYSEQSSFNRACLRWFGRPPEQLRNESQAQNGEVKPEGSGMNGAVFGG
jgi:AraC-like DNA-binding protein